MKIQILKGEELQERLSQVIMDIRHPEVGVKFKLVEGPLAEDEFGNLLMPISYDGAEIYVPMMSFLGLSLAKIPQVREEYRNASPVNASILRMLTVKRILGYLEDKELQCVGVKDVAVTFSDGRLADIRIPVFDAFYC